MSQKKAVKSERMDAQSLWWWELVRCPHCSNVLPLPASAGGSCLGCGAKYNLSDNVLAWENDSLPKLGSRHWKRYLKTLLNPLATPLLPFRYWSRWRLEGYYRRTVGNRKLADKWAAHYLGKIALKSGAMVLDFGCGRGRNIALLNQLGFRVVGQDVVPNPWWRQKLTASGFQTLRDTAVLPWKSGGFDMVVEMMVIQNFSATLLRRHIEEVMRILKPGGYWLLLEANDHSYGVKEFQRQIANLHGLGDVHDLVAANGFEVIDSSFEGFYAPYFPLFINFIRKQCSPHLFDLSDFDSLLASRTLPEKRGMWLLRLRKPFIE